MSASSTSRVHEADSFRIRPATIDDSPGIRSIRNTAIRESLAIWTSVEQDREQAEAWLWPMVERGTALVVSRRTAGGQEEIAGFAVAGPWQPYDGYAHTVEDSIYFTPDVQGRGLGTDLLTALVETCRAAGDHTMVAQIESGHTASIRLHEKVGYDKVGTIPDVGAKHGHLLDLTLMARRLN